MAQLKEAPANVAAPVVRGASEGRILQFCDRIWSEVGFVGADATHGLFAKQEASA